jgi:hypothetical protein
MAIDLIESRELAEILGVNQRRANAIASGRRDFPAPAFEQRDRNGRVIRRLWRRAQVERWLAVADRSPGRPPTGAGAGRSASLRRS